ncbi:hypothetical protein BT96DRAFT_927269 [Gymnopus androsaceus JB14]|uniref:Uncharacterized protein n=1 Tax=Gymnopus androsaceus JB14 TaxID=1447944 RepID=A0A6A4GS68_9AGAR|nr:hypothetical protein BT96DRAFT_927269 [Gymnopus androsaceus JB14]
MTSGAQKSAATTWNSGPIWTQNGWIESTLDALLILEAARRGLIPRVTRRLVDSERKMISSAYVSPNTDPEPTNKIQMALLEHVDLKSSKLS